MPKNVEMTTECHWRLLTVTPVEMK